MSLYPEQEKLASVYHCSDSLSTKKASYPATASFTIKMFIIRLTAEQSLILGELLGDYVANVNGLYTNAGNIRKGDKIVWDSKTFIVENEPRKNILFNSYKLRLRDV